MIHSEMTLSYITFITCVITVQSLFPIQRIERMERLAKASTDLFHNRPKLDIPQDSHVGKKEMRGSASRAVIGSPASEKIILTENDFLDKEGPLPSINLLNIPLFDNEAQIQSPPTEGNDGTTTDQPISIRPEITSRIISTTKTQTTNDNMENNIVGSTTQTSLGSPALIDSRMDPNFEMPDIQETTTAELLKEAQPFQIDPEKEQLDIYNTPINSKEDLSGISSQNVLIQKQTLQAVPPNAQTTMVVKNSDPPPPTVNVEQLIAKQDELFALILQYHTEMNKLVTDIMVKLKEVFP